MSLLVLGSIALDTVKTPLEEHADVLGGSASYAAASASFFTPPRLVGIVGDDFPKAHLNYFKECNIDLEGLQIVPGKTFRWSGEYLWDMNSRETRSTDLNVFENFTPTLPESYRQSPFVLLGNIAPALQLHVLDQLESPRFVVADTMNLWINIAKEELIQLLGRVDMLLLNDSEARELTGETSLIKAGRHLREMGPAYVAIKKGEHGCLLFGKDQFFSCPAFPLEDIHDPTGAGDAFAGALAGYLARESEGKSATRVLSKLATADEVQGADGASGSLWQKLLDASSTGATKQFAAEVEFRKNFAHEIDFKTLRQAIVYGSVMASFTVESFSLDRLRTVTPADIQERFETFQALSVF